MSQNYNNNDYEIINSNRNGYTSRYPFAEAPLQYMNCQDVMSGRNHTIEQQSAIDTATGVSTDVTNDILSFNFNTLSVAGSAIQRIMNRLWPTPSAQEVWQAFMDAVEALIDKKIDEAIYNTALSKLEGLQNALEEYRDRLNIFNQEPTDQHAASLRVILLDIDLLFESTMPEFRVPGFEVTLLTVFVNAANLHLALLRDIITFGAEWGFSELEMTDFYEQGLLELIPEYTDHCVTTYHTGLEDAKKLIGTLNSRDYNKYPYLHPYSGWATIDTEEYSYVLDWNVMNDYRRSMTIMVLDVVALWPTYDPIIYSNLNGTKAELSREVTSTVYGKIGTHFGEWHNWEVIETAFIRRPHLVSWLTDLTFYIKNPPAAVEKQDQFNGIINTLHTTGNATGFQDGTGSKAGAHVSDYGVTIPGEYINAVNMVTGLVPCQFNIYTANAGNYTVGVVETGNEQPEVYDVTATIESHRLVYINGMPTNIYESVGALGMGTWGLSWAHSSLTPENIISPDQITQIPAVKGGELEQGGTVIKGPGSTGGDLVKLPTYNGTWTQLRLYIKPQQIGIPYRVRIRYAAKANASLFVGKYASGRFWETNNLSLTTTTTSDEPLYNEFSYIDAFNMTANESEFKIELRCNSGGPVLIDKIEFIPIEGSLEEYEAKQDLEKAWKAVKALFTDATKSALRLDITDYDVDQAACKVYCMSDDVYLNEKMVLLKLVKHAKRLSQDRNLLKYGDFESPYWLGEGWQANNNVMAVSGDSDCPERYLNMPGATTIDGKLVPTYLYQKVDELRLKPYTRYLVRGFVKCSKELELFVSRYGKEVHAKMNIPFNSMNTWNQTVSMLGKCGTGQMTSYPLSNNPCQTNAYITNASDMTMSSTKGGCEDKQDFVFHIDVGEIDQRANLGIGVGFKISSSSGMAQLENIEVIEANRLTGEALERVKKREQKWKRELEQKCVQTEKFVIPAKQAVDSLFTDARKTKLKPTTTMQNIVSAEGKVRQIPYVHDSVFEEIPGMNFAIFQQLQFDIFNAYDLYRGQNQNLIQNGDFASGLTNWHATVGVDIQERDGRPHVLIISNWGANVSQEVSVQPGRGYVLRVKARKEGSGKGYVNLTDCTVENTETVTFTSNEGVTTPRPPVRPRRSVDPSSICDIPRYSESFGVVPDSNNMISYSAENSGIESGSCGCGNTVHTSATNYQRKAPSSKSSTSNMNKLSSDYITKTIEMFPESNRMRIEIGETEGSFLVESIELICMED